MPPRRQGKSAEILSDGQFSAHDFDFSVTLWCSVQHGKRAQISRGGPAQRRDGLLCLRRPGGARFNAAAQYTSATVSAPKSESGGHSWRFAIAWGFVTGWWFETKR